MESLCDKFVTKNYICHVIVCCLEKNLEKLQLLSDSKLNKQLRKWNAFIIHVNQNHRSIVCFMYFKYEKKSSWSEEHYV